MSNLEVTLYAEVAIAWDMEGPIRWEEIELIAHVDYEPYVPAITHGPADNWEPASGGYVIDKITTLDGEKWSGVLSPEEAVFLNDAIEYKINDEIEISNEPVYDKFDLEDRYHDFDDGREVDW